MRIGLRFGLGSGGRLALAGGAPPDVTAPTLVGLPVVAADGLTITFTYSETLDPASEPATSACAASGVSGTVSGVNVTGSTVVWTMSSPIFDVDVPLTSYTPGASPVQDLAGNDAGALTNQAVTNNSTVVLDPADFPEPRLWLDVQDASNLTQAGTITSINNKLTGVAVTEATNPPAYNATGIYGNPCADGDGTNDQMTGVEAAVLAALTEGQPGTLYIVCRADVADPAAVSVLFGAGSSAVANNRTRRFGTNSTGVGSWRADVNDNAGVAYIAETVGGNVDTNPHIAVWDWDASGLSFGLDFANELLTNVTAYIISGATTPTRFALFCRPDSVPDGFMNGKIGELIFYNARHSATDKLRHKKALWRKWDFVEQAQNDAIDGDSVANGFGSTGNANWASRITLANGGTVTNWAINGDKLKADIIDGIQVATLCAAGFAKPGNRNQNIYLYVGTNDLYKTSEGGSGDRTAAQLYADYQTYVTDAHNRGLRVAGGTIIERNEAVAPLTNVEIRAFNTLMRADHAFLDAYLDLEAAVSGVGGLVDNVHPNETLCAAMAAQVKTCLDSMYIPIPVP